MTFDRLTWMGLSAIALGWALLVAAPSLIALLPSAAAWPNAHIEMAAMAGCIILSGFGLALLAALQAGFAVLEKRIDGCMGAKARIKEGPWPSARASMAGGP